MEKEKEGPLQQHTKSLLQHPSTALHTADVQHRTVIEKKAINRQISPEQCPARSSSSRFLKSEESGFPFDAVFLVRTLLDLPQHRLWSKSVFSCSRPSKAKMLRSESTAPVQNQKSPKFDRVEHCDDTRHRLDVASRKAGPMADCMFPLRRKDPTQGQRSPEPCGGGLVPDKILKPQYECIITSFSAS